MILFAASDKGGTGRSVTSANLAYRRALHGDHVCYVDFDFGSPTTAAVFDIPGALRGVERHGLHPYLRGDSAEPARIDIWAQTEHAALRLRPPEAGRLVLLPGDRSGGEFPVHRDALRRCADLLLRLTGEFDLVMVDLSAGRSFATDMVLAATSRPELRAVEARWLVYHFWDSETGRRYLRAQREAIQTRGVRVRRLFLVAEPADVDEALERQFENQQSPGIDVRVLVLASVSTTVRLGATNDFVVFDDELSYEVAFDFEGINATTTLNFVPDRVRQRVRRFNELWEAAR